MSQVTYSGAYLAPHASAGWTTHWNNSGWQGNTLIEPQPLNPSATLTWTIPSVTLNTNGTYSFGYSVTNVSAAATTYNLQISAS